VNDEHRSGSVPPQNVATPRARRGAPPLRSLALVAAGGALGAVARVGFAVWFPVVDGAFPWTTLAENIAGAFALALVLTLLTERLTADPGVRLFLCTGTLGAFTTYSTVANEVVVRLLSGHAVLAAVYVGATLAGGLLAAVVGARLARGWPWVARRARGRSRRGGAAR
jgi:CrcB protein